MRILYVYDGEWPKGATRVYKETQALAADGHEVWLVARNLANAPSVDHETWMTVRRLPRLPLAPVRYALSFPLFFNPIWLFHIWRVARVCRPHLIIVCDLPLALSAAWVGGLIGVAVHYDMAEIYPEFLRSLRSFERMGPIKRLIRNPTLADILERRSLKRMAATYVVSEESRIRCERLGVSADRLVLVGNTPANLEELCRPVARPPDLDGFVAEGAEILLFVGILIGDRGVRLAIHALARLRERRPTAVLVIVGDGPERPLIERDVRELRLDSAVLLAGWRQHYELTGYYQAAHVGLLPFHDSPHVRLTLANKLFDYMGAGLPVLAADLPPMRRIVTETETGRLHLPNDPEDLARVAGELLADSAGRERMRTNGIQAVRTTYCWQRDAERLCEAARVLR